MNCVVSSQKPFSVEGMAITKQIRKLTKMVKPIMRLLSRRARTNAITPSCCTYDVEETQNQINEAQPFDLEFQFHHEEDDNARNEALENRQNDLNEALEQRLRESVSAQTSHTGIRVVSRDGTTVQPVIPGTYFAMPVHFVEAPTGGFLWVPLADADFAPHAAVTEMQLPCQQVPCIV